MDLQYFFEKLLEILFWSKLTLGSEVSNAKTIGGFNTQTINKQKPKNNFINSYKIILLNNIVVFSMSYQLNQIIHKNKN